MNTLTAGMATFILFGGQNLDGWIKLSGVWELADGAITCTSSPASIRSVFESDQFTLTFQYRRADKGANRLFVHSKLITGGTGLMLTSAGLSAASPGASAAAAASATDGTSGDDQWISAKITVEAGKLQATTSSADGHRTARIEAPVPAGARGFLRFECDQPGLQIRDVQAAEPGFTSLFDGKTLDGWEIVRPKDPVTPGWVVEDGVIRCQPKQSSWLRTLRTHDNFILRLEYRLPPRGNSGIYVRAPIEGRVSRIGMEFQLLDDAGFKGRVKPSQLTGSIYDGIAPEVQVPCPPDQWNAIEVMVDGHHARSTLNGTQLFDALLTDAKKDTNAKVRPLATRRLTGFIGLQDHSAPVRFRNIRIQELPKTTTRAVD